MMLCCCLLYFLEKRRALKKAWCFFLIGLWFGRCTGICIMYYTLSAVGVLLQDYLLCWPYTPLMILTKQITDV